MSKRENPEDNAASAPKPKSVKAFPTFKWPAVHSFDSDQSSPPWMTAKINVQTFRVLSLSPHPDNSEQNRNDIELPPVMLFTECSGYGNQPPPRCLINTQTLIVLETTGPGWPSPCPWDRKSADKMSDSISNKFSSIDQIEQNLAEKKANMRQLSKQFVSDSEKEYCRLVHETARMEIKLSTMKNSVLQQRFHDLPEVSPIVGADPHILLYPPKTVPTYGNCVSCFKAGPLQVGCNECEGGREGPTGHFHVTCQYMAMRNENRYIYNAKWLAEMMGRPTELCRTGLFEPSLSVHPFRLRIDTIRMLLLKKDPDSYHQIASLYSPPLLES